MTFMLRMLSRNTPVREHQKSERERLHGTGKFAHLIGETLTTPRPLSPAALKAGKIEHSAAQPAGDVDDASQADVTAADSQPLEKSKVKDVISPMLAGVLYPPPPLPAEEPAPEMDAAAQALTPTITALLDDAPPAAASAATSATGDDLPVSKSEIVGQLAAESGETEPTPSKPAPKAVPPKAARTLDPPKRSPAHAMRLEENEPEAADEVSQSQSDGEKITPPVTDEEAAPVEHRALRISGPDTKGFVKDAPGAGEPRNARGMSAALQDGTMHYTHEADETSGAARQKLPSFGDTEDSGRNRQEPFAAKAKDGKPASIASNETAPPVLPATPDRVADLPGATPEKGNSPSSRAVMRTVENLAEDLRQGNAVSMVVTLKPDADTHISLHVKQHGGHLEAIAVLERGDFKSLNTEWNHLQTRLAKRGIRLAPLVGNGARVSDSGSNASSSRQQSHNPSAAELPGPAETTRASGKTAAQNAKPPVATEWWA